MARLKLGVVLNSLNRPLRQGLQLASTLGVAGVQVDAVGDLAPEGLSQSGRKDFRNLLRSLSLELTAVGCPLRYGLSTAQGLDARIAHIQKTLTLAYDLGPRVVVVSAGGVPEDENHPGQAVLIESLTALGRFADRVGSTLALEVGLEKPATLKAFLSRTPSGALAVNLDPANLLGRGFDPIEAVREFGTLIVHTHARDARLQGADRQAQEVPLGHGDIDWITYLGALEEAGYHGWLTIKRGPSADPAADIKEGVAFLRRLVG